MTTTDFGLTPIGDLSQQEVAGLVILVPLNVIIWLNVGFSETCHARTRAWIAVTVLYAMWTVQYATLGYVTAFVTGVNAIVFGIIAFYRWCIENPDSRPASFAAGHFKHWNPPREDEL